MATFEYTIVPDNLVELSLSNLEDDTSYASLRLEISNPREVDPPKAIKITLPSDLTTAPSAVVPISEAPGLWQIDNRREDPAVIIATPPDVVPDGQTAGAIGKDQEVYIQLNRIPIGREEGLVNLEIVEERDDGEQPPILRPVRKVQPSFRIDYFNATHEPGSDQVTLSWASTAASKVTLNGVEMINTDGTPNFDGSVILSPDDIFLNEANEENSFNKLDSNLNQLTRERNRLHSEVDGHSNEAAQLFKRIRDERDREKRLEDELAQNPSPETRQQIEIQLRRIRDTISTFGSEFDREEELASQKSSEMDDKQQQIDILKPRVDKLRELQDALILSDTMGVFQLRAYGAGDIADEQPGMLSKEVVVKKGPNTGIGTAAPKSKLTVIGGVTIGENDAFDSDVGNGNLKVEGSIEGNIDAKHINTGSLPLSVIPDLNASKITSGTLSSSVTLPDLDAGKITSGTLGSGVIPDLDAGKITTGTLSSERLSISRNNIRAGFDSGWVKHDGNPVITTWYELNFFVANSTNHIALCQTWFSPDDTSFKTIYDVSSQIFIIGKTDDLGNRKFFMGVPKIEFPGLSESQLENGWLRILLWTYDFKLNNMPSETLLPH